MKTFKPTGANFTGELIPGDPELANALILIPDDARVDYVRVRVIDVGPGWTGEKTGTVTPTGLSPGDIAQMLFGHWSVGSDVSEFYESPGFGGKCERPIKVLKASGVSMVVG